MPAGGAAMRLETAVMLRAPLTRCLLSCMLAVVLAACTPPRERANEVVIWHQKTGAERAFFEEAVETHNRLNPEERVVALYREGEELRNSFIIAAVAVPPRKPLRSIRRVLAPCRAAPMAAPSPAGPPPATTTSYCPAMGTRRAASST